MDKTLTARGAIERIESGMTVGIGGWGPRRKPMALVRELLNSEVTDLTLVSYGGADVGMLCAAGKVKKLIFAFVSLDFIPLEPFFRQARQNGELEVTQLDEGMILMGLRAAAWNMPFLPTRVGLGTSIQDDHPEIAVIESPYDDKEWLAMPALNLDVSLLHVDRADQRGVCQIKGPDIYMDEWFARAARETIVSCDELVDTSYFHQADEARYVFWERSSTAAVVPIPGGAHPTSCTPLYGFDVSHFKEYAGFAKEGGFAAYREKFLAGGNEESYQDSVGGLAKIRAIDLPVY